MIQRRPQKGPPIYPERVQGTNCREFRVSVLGIETMELGRYLPFGYLDP